MEINKHILVKVNAVHDRYKKQLESRIGFEGLLKSKDLDIKHDKDTIKEQNLNSKKYTETYHGKHPYSTEALQIVQSLYYENRDNYSLESDGLEWMFKRLPIKENQEFTINFSPTKGDNVSFPFKLNLNSSIEE